MFDHLKSQWQALRNSPPGHRFTRYHERLRGTGRSTLRRIALLLLGGTLVIVGVILMPAPGPGMLIVLAGACVLARESSRVALGLDRLELFARERWRRLRG